MPVPRDPMSDSFRTDLTGFSDGQARSMSRGTVKTGQDIKAHTQMTSMGLTTQMSEKEYDPMEGIELYFDYLSKLYDSFSSVKFVYSIYNLNDQQIEPVQSETFYS